MNRPAPLSSWTALAVAVLAFIAGVSASAQGSQAVADYFNDQTAILSSNCLSNIHSLAQWEALRPKLQREAAEMLGLYPMPKRTPLDPVITGKIEEKDFTVEKLYFQSCPHLYVTADLYLPKPLARSEPAVLYLCGHLPMIINGVSYGNKTSYQQHGIWFARNGYVCLIIDTVQYGEILGHHRGTYDEGAWWWNSRGYTPAGIEAWDAIRALDYLETLSEVDTNRIGVTGRSGGGAYSWFLAAVDHRAKVIAPVAGITDLQDYCADGRVDDHCDCMFLVNTYRWDYPMLAALCAPRPLLLANSDTDEYFPLDGVLHTHDLVKRIYDLYGAGTNFGLVITPGPHQDTQDLRIPVFHWFNIYLKHEDPLINMAAVKMFSPQQLKVFKKLPADAINDRIEDSFEPEAKTPEVPANAEEWETLTDGWTRGLQDKCFAGWPDDPSEPQVKTIFSKEQDGIQCREYDVQSQKDVALPLFVMCRAGAEPQRIILRVPGESFSNTLPAWQGLDFRQFMSAFGSRDAVAKMLEDVGQKNVAFAIFLPRDVGPVWRTDAFNQTQLRRRFMLLGQTLDGMRVWDICRGITALRALPGFAAAPLTVEAEQGMGVNALYASLFTPGIDRLRLRRLPSKQVEGPDYINVLKILDIPEAAAMAAARCELQIQSGRTNGWDFLKAMDASPAVKLNLKWIQ